MTKNQILGQMRALLLAIGSMLATWGFTDGHDWLPVIGIILAGWSVTWGILHHKDPSKPGTVSWSLFRKFVNAGCVAAVTYGWMTPEKSDAMLKILPLLGPVIASRFSWIDNSEEEDASSGGPPTYLWILLLMPFFLLPSCADFPVNGNLETPYGTVSTDAKGGLVITPRVTVIRVPLREK